MQLHRKKLNVESFAYKSMLTLSCHSKLSSEAIQNSFFGSFWLHIIYITPGNGPCGIRGDVFYVDRRTTDG